MKAQSCSTMVLKRISLFAGAPVISGGMAEVTITNTGSQTEMVQLYAADSDSDTTVRSRTVAAAPGITRAEIEAGENSRIFVWDSNMRPIN